MVEIGSPSPSNRGPERPDPLDTSDIEGAQSRKSMPRTRTVHPSMSNLDIAGSTPSFANSHGRFTSARRIDPLNPQYGLPTADYVPPPQPREPPKELLWTLPQETRTSATRAIMDWSDVDGFHTNHKFMRDVPTRQQFLATADISGPQFLSEAPSTRRVDPLEPNYVYDGGPYGEVDTKSKKYGSMFPRKDEEAFGLMTKDISAGFSSSNPKATYLLSTRTINRTDDITGAQADTKGAGPQIWRKPGKDPATCYEKETNRTWDIDGAVAGTGGQSIRLYRAARQAEAIERGKAARVAQEEKRAANAAAMAAKLASSDAPTAAAAPVAASPTPTPPRSAAPAASPARSIQPTPPRSPAAAAAPAPTTRETPASRQADIDAVSALP